MATLVLTTAVTDKPAATTPSPAEMTRIVLAPVTAVEQVLVQWLRRTGSFHDNASTGKCAMLGKVSAAAVFEGGATAVSIWLFAKSVVCDMCR